jgi:hypothetical protein
MSAVAVTNHGPVDVYDLDVHPAEDEDSGLYRETAELPVACLPAGKSVKALDRLPMTLESTRKSYFNVVITGRTADGLPNKQTEFVSSD